MPTLQTAIALYSVRELASENLENTLARLSAMGYDGVELAGLYGHSPDTIRTLTERYKLTPICAHVPYESLLSDTENVLGQYAAIGCPYLAIPYLTEEFRPQSGRFEEVIANIRTIALACRRHSIRLLYHNHDFEFVMMDNGQYGLDYLFASVEPDLLETEIDTCWVKVAGLDPAAYLRQYAGRSPIVHLKDFTGQGESFAFRAVGHGVQDIPAIVQAAIDGGAIWQIVEQDAHPVNDAMENARLSIQYLQSLHV